jgi:hypothetical protein
MSLVGYKARNHVQQVRKRGPNPKVDDRATAPETFDPLQERFGFTLDVAASPRNAKLPRFFVSPDYQPSARDLQPSGVDGLAQSWDGERVWCNPPYSDIRPWVEKAWDSNAELVVMLLPANRTEQGWWQDCVEPFRDHGDFRVEFLRGRLRFIARDADCIKPNERPPFGCCLLIWA